MIDLQGTSAGLQNDLVSAQERAIAAEKKGGVAEGQALEATQHVSAMKAEAERLEKAYHAGQAALAYMQDQAHHGWLCHNRAIRGMEQGRKRIKRSNDVMYQSSPVKGAGLPPSFTVLPATAGDASDGTATVPAIAVASDTNSGTAVPSVAVDASSGTTSTAAVPSVAGDASRENTTAPTGNLSPSDLSAIVEDESSDEWSTG